MGTFIYEAICKDNPFRIFGIVFVAFNGFYPYRVSNGNIDVIFKKIEDRNPVFTGGFHTDIMAIVFKKPLTELPHNKTKSFNNS